MKTTKFKISLKDGFYVVVKDIKSESNYNKFASLFKEGEKSPYMGKMFKSDTTKEQYKIWGEDSIYLHQYEKLNNLLNLI